MKTYYLTFRAVTSLIGEPMGYGPQATVFVERAPVDAYKVLKAARMRVAYGREGEKPIRDSYPFEPWDCDAGESKPSGARS